jgi:hypothetical protein
MGGRGSDPPGVIPHLHEYNLWDLTVMLATHVIQPILNPYFLSKVASSDAAGNVYPAALHLHPSDAFPGYFSHCRLNPAFL